MKNGLTLAGLITALAMLTCVPQTVVANETLLAGTIKSSSGEKMGGVTVSAKAAGGTITTTVFTDDVGNYYFPPMPAGKYRVWAQALAFETAKSDVDLDQTKHQDFTLAPIKDFERQVRQ